MYRDLLVFILLLLQSSLSSSQCPNTSKSIPQYCPYFNNRPLDQSTPLLTSSSNCYWYAPQACCTFLEAELVVGETAYNLFTESSVECLDLLNLLVCYVCSPNQTNFYQPGRLAICQDFCNRIFSTCSTAIWKGNTLKQQFNNSTHFCLSRGYTIVDISDTNSCFNTGYRICKQIGCLFICLFISVLFSNFRWQYIFGIFLFISALSYTESQLLATDVNDWADSLGSFTQSVTRDILRVDSLQTTFNSANYSHLYVNGSLLRDEMSGELSLIYQEVVQAVNTLAGTTEQLFNAQCESNQYSQYTTLDSLRQAGLFYDSDTTTFPENSNKTSVKISESVDRGSLINAIAVTSNLTNTFINIQKSSQYISTQYFASVHGFLREFPAREWERDFIGFPKEFDPRLQSWYHVATSRPKDIVIVVDCSSSMLENDRWQLALSTIEIILQTLTQEDFINIICSASSVYLNQDSSTPTYIDARVLSTCSEDGLIPATSGIKRHLIGLLKEEQPIGGLFICISINIAYNI
ncbi:VWFA and cache domain-containing protein 1-like [Oopsacas minuta]|uniref:VWFA and cache domain-containing protein 1-like n=1 Tax=Oopsacas minuta TaxID=111878 RepID=A0AAV7KJF9_9METZ|nr:VWFA and cache domain-containing protein 1-like [Oopsacas minuta]